MCSPRLVWLERLEGRTFLSAANTVRVVTYNIEADVNGYTTPRPGLYQVLEGIGEEQVQGAALPIDVLALQETTSNSTTVAPIVSALNGYYNGAAVYAQSSYQATQSGTNASGNGPSALIYNTSTLRLLASVGVGTPTGSTNGEFRQVVRYEFQPVADTGIAGVFYLYVSHMKSGTSSSDASDRAGEAAIIRNDEATLPAGASVLYAGDLNASPPDAGLTRLTAAGQGQACDPVNFSAAITWWTESATNLRYRDDYQLMTQNVLNGAVNLGLVAGSFHVFGNNGSTPQNGSVNSGSDTALNNDLVSDGGTFIPASTLYSDLATASDHLPAVADYTVAAPPMVAGVTPQDPAGQGTAAGSSGGQRSIVSQLQVVFSEPVKLAAGAFNLGLVNNYGSGESDGSADTDVSQVLGTPTNPSGDGITWIIPVIQSGTSTTFSYPLSGMAGVTAGVACLQDGAYHLSVNPSAVTAAAGGAATGSGYTSSLFHRLFGDADGNGTVNALDFAKFKSAFGAGTGSGSYNADLDFDGNGTVNAADYAQFKNRFGKTFNYT